MRRTLLPGDFITTRNIGNFPDLDSSTTSPFDCSFAKSIRAYVMTKALYVTAAQNALALDLLCPATSDASHRALTQSH
jgi:hypothetical protein